MKKITLTIGHNVGPVEAINTATICAAVTNTLHINGFTAIPCVGMWQGMGENSTRIEIVTDDADAARINELVPTLAWQLNQEAIMCEVASSENITFIAAVAPAVA